jgi:gamma-glutamylputrescine oxidase
LRLLQTDQALAQGSYYTASCARPQAWPALRDDLRCDVAVVGGGLAGLSAALELAEAGRQVVLLEARQIGWGASGRNGGQAIHGLACDQSVIEEQLGLGAARQVWDMTIEAIDLIRRRIATYQIDCDWQGGYLGLAVNARKARALQDWADRTEQVYGYPLQRVKPADVQHHIASTRFHSGLYDPQGGHLHPLKYTLGLARAAQAAGVTIFEESAVTALERGPQRSLLRTASGTVSAEQVLLAGNVYLGNNSHLAPALAARIMPVGTYIVCTEPLGEARCTALIPSRAAVCDSNFVLDYFRPTADHRLLYGGRVSYSTATPRHLPESMKARMTRTFPQLADAAIDFAWGGFVDITMNRAPDFGRLPCKGSGPAAPAAAPVYYLQGFSGHGLALTGLAGKLVAEAMTGDAARFDVFTRLRHAPFPGGELLRMPSLVLGMAWYRLMDRL